MTVAPVFDYIAYCETDDNLDCHQTMMDYTNINIRSNASQTVIDAAKTELRRRSQFLKDAHKPSTVYLSFGGQVRWGVSGTLEAWDRDKNSVCRQLAGQDLYQSKQV